jgi:membrane-associated phospholipid phosphatase
MISSPKITKILELDAAISTRLRLKPGAGFWWGLMAFLAHSGDSWFWAAGMGLVWLLVPSWRTRAALLTIGIVGLALTVFAVKFLIRRQRPEGEWGAIYRNTDPHSFPSGHAARAALLAVMAWVLGPDWFRWGVLAWLPLVSLARIAMGLHYLTDVLAGLVMGCAAGLFMLWIAPLLTTWFPFLW